MIEKIQGFLTDNEKILENARIHEIVLVPPIVYLFIALLAGLFFHPIMGAVILLLTLYPLYNAIIYFRMTYLVLTNKKVMSREGFLSRDWIRMDFDRIENAFLEEPILGRYLGYSTVIVSGVGSGSIAVSYVRNGDKFIKALEQQLANNRDKRG
jgi:uncharacterized membrane protein YdbT with pleckstrin-like domain